MTANSSIDPVQFLAEHIERVAPDLLCSMLTRFVEALMGAEQFPIRGAVPSTRPWAVTVVAVAALSGVQGLPVRGAEAGAGVPPRAGGSRLGRLGVGRERCGLAEVPVDGGAGDPEFGGDLRHGVRAFTPLLSVSSYICWARSTWRGRVWVSGRRCGRGRGRR